MQCKKCLQMDNREKKIREKVFIDLCCAEYAMTEETISWSKLKFLVSTTESQFGVTASEIVLSEKYTMRYQREKINQQRTKKAKPFTWWFCFVLFMDLGTDNLRLWDVSCTHPNSVCDFSLAISVNLLLSYHFFYQEDHRGLILTQAFL